MGASITDGRLSNTPNRPPQPPQFFPVDFDYALPQELIAQFPLAERSASRLLDGRSGAVVDRVFSDLPSLLRNRRPAGVQRHRVLNARLRAVKASSGAVGNPDQTPAVATLALAWCAPAMRRSPVRG